MAIIDTGFSVILTDAQIPLPIPRGQPQPAALRFVGASAVYQPEALVLPDGTRIAGVAITLGPGLSASSDEPLPIGTADPGEGLAWSRWDHVHAHGNQGGGAQHAAASGAAAGFMSAADKSKLDGIEAGADVTDEANVRAALAALTADPDFNGRELENIANASSSTSAVAKGQMDLALTNTLELADANAENVANGLRMVWEEYTTAVGETIERSIPAGVVALWISSAVGAGGGGGGGACRGAGVAAGGGGGGGAGAYNEGTFDLTAYSGGTIEFVMGAPGPGGAGASAADGNGTVGVSGGTTLVRIQGGDTLLTVAGGSRGNGGTASAGSGGAGGATGSLAGGSGGAGGSSGAPSAGLSGSSGTAAGGGGGGAGLSIADATNNGGDGGSRATRASGTVVATGGTAPGGDGAAGAARAGKVWGGGGGSGGASSTSGDGGDGGVGTDGGGGGGGGGARNGSGAGSGGAGGQPKIRAAWIYGRTSF